MNLKKQLLRVYEIKILLDNSIDDNSDKYYRELYEELMELKIIILSEINDFESQEYKEGKK